MVIGHTKLIQIGAPLKPRSRDRPKPTVADVELLTDQPNTRLLNIYGLRFGTTTITFWDENDKPLTFLVRVTIDTLDLEARLRQVFPGAVLHIRQVGQQLILEGQVPDAKTMSDIIQAITSELRLTGQASAGSLSGALGFGGRRWWRRRWWRSGDQCQCRHQPRFHLAWAPRRNAQPGLIHHQSRPRPGSAPGLAPRQDRRAEPRLLSGSWA